MDFRKRVDESGRQLNLKRGEVAQAERALNERETSVQRLQSAMASFGGRGGAEFNPRTSGSQPVNFFNSGSNQAEPVSIFSSQQPVLGGRDHIWTGVSSSQGGRGGVLVVPTSQGLCSSRLLLFCPFLLPLGTYYYYNE